MTRRELVPVLAFLFFVVTPAAALAQATAAAPTAQAPAAPAKWVTPMKGEGTIEVIKGKPQRVGNDMVTTLKIKNTSSGALAMLIVDEYWYAPVGNDTISGDTQRHKPLFHPGEVIEMTTKSPWRADMNRSTLMFKHANGNIKAKAVTKFVDPK